MKLSEQQEEILSIVGKGKNIFITGPAGTGKSFLVDKIIEQYSPNVDVTASTGIAAVNIGGITLHSWAGLGLGDKPVDEIVDKILEKKSRPYRAIKNCEKLIIDEISMIDGKLLNKLNEVLKEVRGFYEPFGGIQLILSGDFFQLPPVAKDEEERQFAFESKSWADANIETHELNTVFRQSDKEFIECLSEMRFGRCSSKCDELFQEKGLKLEEGDIKPTKLFSHNADADKLNNSELNKLEGEQNEYMAEDWGQKPFIDMVSRYCIAPSELNLKVGAQVMLLHNLNQRVGLVNGSIGIVEKFIDGVPFVRFNNGRAEIIDKHSWEIKIKDEVVAYRKQIPLRLAWAITIHKSQGMTLDKVECNLSKVFEYGQAYVALSRAKTLEGLLVRGFDKSRVKAHPTVRSYFN